jgi:hypothetical protein
MEAMKIEEPLVKPMIRDAAIRYCAIVSINQSNRDPKQAQQFHICHMFVHNYFKHQLPKYHTGKTIAWEHISDPAVEWALIDSDKTDILRTRHGRRARLTAAQQWEEAPDEHASRHAAAKFLSDYRVTGMAAPGINGCGEPCGCGGHQSKHITGEACDLHGLDQLGYFIMSAEPGKYSDPIDAVDGFLREHGLQRPMGHLKGKQQELWHVEAIARHLTNLPPHHLKTHQRLSRRQGAC